MDQDLYQKLMLEPEVLQGIGNVALREAEKEIKTQEQDFARKVLAHSTTNAPLILGILGHFHRVPNILKHSYCLDEVVGGDLRSYEERYKERVSNRAGEIFLDYISRLDILEEFKKSGYRFMDELSGDDKNTLFVCGNHD